MSAPANGGAAAEELIRSTGLETSITHTPWLGSGFSVRFSVSVSVQCQGQGQCQCQC